MSNNFGGFVGEMNRAISEVKEMKESAVVLYQGVVWEVVECSSVTAFCKQNLKFNLTLKTRQYVVSY